MTSAVATNMSQFFLCVGFSIACRWIKRHPSDFLRYLLFRFGGLQVERWPQDLLLMIRAGASISFFFLIESALSAVFPTGSGAFSEALKLTIALVVSLIALRGSAEINPQRGPSSQVPDPLQEQPPSVPQASFAQGPSPAQPRLSDIEAPAIPQRVFPESTPPKEVVIRRVKYAFSSVVIGTILAVIIFLLGSTRMSIVFAALLGLGAGLQLLTMNIRVVRCPFCGAFIERYDKSGKPVRCPSCSEYSRLVFGSLHPLNPQDSSSVAEELLFRSPAFENAVWPNGCVLCGAPPVRFDEASAVYYRFRTLALPVSALYSNPAAHVSGIPYCQRHRDAVRVVAPMYMFSSPLKYFPGYAERIAEKRKAFLLWRSLPMMRRYLEANRRANSVVSTGHRGPSLFRLALSLSQRIVTDLFSGVKPETPHSSSREDASKPRR